MNGSTIPAVLMTALVVLTVVPGNVAAQGAPGGVFLNQETERVATVTVDDETYEVYHYDNLLPYASGIDIYSDGDRVTSESKAREVLTALARRRAASRIGPDEVRMLRTTERNLSEVTPHVSEATRTLDDTLVYVAALETVRVDGTTAYNASVEAAPEIREFEDAGRELLPRLRSFQNDSEAFSANVTALARLVERRENGTAVDPRKLYNRYLMTLRAEEALSEHLVYDGIDEGLSGVATQSATISENAATVPERGEEISRQFATLHNASAVAANRTAALQPPGFELEDPRDRADALASEWLNEWRTRRNAAGEVYGTMGGLAVALLAGVGYTRWR